MLSVYLGGKPGGGQCSCVVGVSTMIIHPEREDLSTPLCDLHHTSQPVESILRTPIFKQNKTAKKFAEPKIESTQKGDPLYLLTQQWMMPILF